MLIVLPIRNYWRSWVVEFETRRSVHTAWVMLVDSPDFFSTIKHGESPTGGGAVHVSFFFREAIPEATLRVLVADT